MILTEKQEAAIALCLDRSRRIVGVTGAAGTGKTSILKYVREALDADNTALCAPTGRAAKRIQEATGFKASTIHRMMRYGMPDDDDDASLPAHNQYNPLPYTTILVDEASMIDEELYRNVIDAMPTGSVIRFFGDINQLPPVNGRSPFAAILEKYDNVTLDENFRSGDGIISVSQAILKGRTPEPNDKFVLINPGQGKMLNAADEFVDDSFRGMSKQIIIPTKKGKYGTWDINRYMQQKLNPTGKALRFDVRDPKDPDIVDKRVLRVGDKVIQTKNDYNIKVFNGQIGWIEDLDEEDGWLDVNFDGRTYHYPPVLERYDEHRGRKIFAYDPRVSVELGYAITTHKAQGSEFDLVLLMLNNSYVLNRQNFYTAVTRAKNKVVCILGPGALNAALKNRK